MSDIIELPALPYDTMRITEALLQRLKWDMTRTALTGRLKTNLANLSDIISILLDERHATKDALEMRQHTAQQEMHEWRNDAVTRNVYKVIEQLMAALLAPKNDAALARLRAHCVTFVRDHRGGPEEAEVFGQWVDDYTKALKIASHIALNPPQFS